jgi:signal transduction histidine kinase
MIGALELSELEEKAQLLALILGATQDGVVDWNLLTGKTRYNPRWRHLLGFDDKHNSEFTESDGLWRELVHPEDKQRFEDSLQDHLRQDWPFILTVRMRHRHGPYRYILCRGATLRDEQHKPLRMVLTFADIDYQVRTEERERALASAVPDTMFRLDSAGKIIDLKPGVEREGSPFKLLREGRTIRECVPAGRLLECLEAAIAAAQNTENPRQTQASLVPSGTAEQPIFHELRLVLCDQFECVCIARDVTEQRSLEDRLRQSQKLESIGQLAAGVAHEINTPMQFIGDNLHFASGAIVELIALFDQLKTKLGSSVDRAWRETALLQVAELEAAADFDFMRTELPVCIERSLGGVERVTKIVKAMKAFSHPGGSGLEPTDLTGLIESTVVVASNEWKYVANVVLQLAPASPPVVCNGGEMNQVLLNLIVNAAHAIADVVGDTGEKGQITIGTSFDPTHAEIRVQDTGTGIPERARAKVFDPFFTTKEVGKGTGQGLSMAYHCIVERHKGTLTFETELGRGTTFVIRLPLVAAPSSSSGVPP